MEVIFNAPISDVIKVVANILLQRVGKPNYNGSMDFNNVINIAKNGGVEIKAVPYDKQGPRDINCGGGDKEEAKPKMEQYRIAKMKPDDLAKASPAV